MINFIEKYLQSSSISAKKILNKIYHMPLLLSLLNINGVFLGNRILTAYSITWTSRNL